MMSRVHLPFPSLFKEETGNRLGLVVRCLEVLHDVDFYVSLVLDESRSVVGAETSS